jgi:hypothetical protein
MPAIASSNLTSKLESWSLPIEAKPGKPYEVEEGGDDLLLE